MFLGIRQPRARFRWMRLGIIGHPCAGFHGHEKSSRVMVTDFASIASMTFINVAISGIWPLRSRATVVGLIFNILAVARTDPIKSSFFVIVLSFIKPFLSLLLLAIAQAR